MSKKNIVNYRKIFISLLWEQLNTDCNPYYRGIGNNNMYSLIKDFIYYLNLEKSLIRQPQINILLEEFLNLIDGDIVFNSNFRKNSNEIIYDIKENKNDLDIIKLKKNLIIIFKYFNNDDKYIKALLGIINGYLNEELYLEEYENNYDKNVTKLKKLTFIFISFLRDEIGISRKYLEFLRENNLNNIDASNSIQFNHGFSQFTKLFFGDKQEYKVYFKIQIGSIQANKRKIEKKNIKYVIEKIEDDKIEYISDINNEISGKEIKDSFKERKNDFIKEDDSIFFICIRINGKDIHSIYKKAKEHINRILDTFLYEFNALKLNISPISLLSNNERIFIVDDGYSEYVNRKKGNEHNIISLNKILNSESYDFDTRSKISNSIKYYKLFLASENSEVKLLNLWIALESLFSGIDSSDGSFEKLKSFIPKLISMNLMKNYFDEFQNFILHRIEMENENESKYKNHNKIKNIISRSNKVKDNFGEDNEKFNNVGIFKYFITNDFTEIETLLHNPYFIQKYKRLKNLIEIDKDGTYKRLHIFLKRYENEVKWILTKIYRYRNYIVHGGKKIDTNIIINDLEFFYLELVDDILDKIGCNYLYINSLDEYFSRVNRSYNLYDKGINNRLKDHNISYKNTVLPYIVY
ncbi:hypothetical protein HUU51_01640 [Candidatus Gracilibacteria bacterium]|nr:hypothetical protein [Candidatus Gracilibacteria bacterium]